MLLLWYSPSGSVRCDPSSTSTVRAGVMVFVWRFNICAGVPRYLTSFCSGVTSSSIPNIVMAIWQPIPSVRGLPSI